MTIEQIIFRLFLALLIGGLIGIERGRHNRAAGMRTHILVCLGATLAAMTGIFAHTVIQNGDVMRLAAQVISGVGFLGAGMIVLKGSTVKGLTTAAGVWTTATIGIALGYGFYLGAGICAAFFLISTTLFALFEKRKRHSEEIYLEIKDMSLLNETLNEISTLFPKQPDFEIAAPKSGKQGNVGIIINTDKRYAADIKNIIEIENVLFAVED
ncbi:MAG: MgtC/SapB family protein [Clostridia bacterium]|nr:MgtC/SapB family protein [Clostridia bacterium]